ncbi:MAG: ribosome maturation factor RimP [Nannocystaceae bacterium]|nr:ribosome maturation factor RimP [Nannocystaceae bacterium]
MTATHTEADHAAIAALAGDAVASSHVEPGERLAAVTALHAAQRALETVIEPVLRTMGYALVHLELAATARPRVVRIFVDCDGGVTLDDCARLSPIVSNALDAAEHDHGAQGDTMRALLAAPYVLEVSSPGVERPLSRRSHFERFVGQRATVRTHAPVDPGTPQKTFHGTIAGARPDPIQPDDDHEGIALLLDEDGTRTHEIPLSLIRRAHLVWSPEPTPAPRGKRPSAAKAV